MSMDMLERDPSIVVRNRIFGMPKAAVSSDIDAIFAELVQKYTEPTAVNPMHQEAVMSEPVTSASSDIDAIFAGLVQKYTEPQIEREAVVSELGAKTEKAERKGISLRAKIVGGVALAAALVLSGLSVSSKDTDREDARTVAAVEQVANTINIEQQTPAESTTTTEIPVPEPFLPQPGEVFGTLEIPAICEEILIKEYSQQEEIDYENGHISERDMTFADLVEDNTPNDGCENVDAYEQRVESGGGDFVRRTERYRSSAVTEANPDGNVTHWQPVAGHGKSIEGENLYLSALPNMEGNIALGMHGSTYSAAGADLEVLVPGDVVRLKFDGKVYEYQFVLKEIIPVDATDDYAQILNYSHPASPRTLSLFNCNSMEGMTGDSDASGTYRFVHIRTY